jgi:hypothetical protein
MQLQEPEVFSTRAQNLVRPAIQTSHFPVGLHGQNGLGVKQYRVGLRIVWRYRPANLGMPP